MNVWFKRVKMSCVISSPLLSRALICSLALASCEFPALAPSSSRRDASQMFSTCFRNRAKNFSSRGRSFIVPRRGEHMLKGATILSSLLQIGDDGKQFRLRGIGPDLRIEEPRIEQPAGIQVAHGGQHVLFEVGIVLFQFAEDVAQRAADSSGFLGTAAGDHRGSKRGGIAGGDVFRDIYQR